MLSKEIASALRKWSLQRLAFSFDQSLSDAEIKFLLGSAKSLGDYSIESFRLDARKDWQLNTFSSALSVLRELRVDESVALLIEYRENDLVLKNDDLLFSVLYSLTSHPPYREESIVNMLRLKVGKVNGTVRDRIITDIVDEFQQSQQGSELTASVLRAIRTGEYSFASVSNEKHIRNIIRNMI